MSRKSRRKKSIFKSRFYQIYFAVVLVALIAIAIGTGWLKGVLRDYESAQPIYVAEDVAKLFENGDYESIYAVDSSAAQISEGDKAFYVESMRQIAAGKTVEWSEAFSTSEDERKYNVTLDGDRFASFTLVPSGQTTRRGNRLWTLGDVTTYVTRREEPAEEPAEAETAPEEPAQLYECRVTVPTGYEVTVDGAALGEANAQVTPDYLFEDGFLPEGVENPMMTAYVFSAASESPEIVVTDDEGAAVALNASAERERTWSCGPKEDAAMREQYSAAAYKLGQQIAKFMSKDGSKKSITKLCLKKSPAWEIFDNLSNRYATPHKGVSFRNEAVTEFYRLSDNCFTCRVSFDYVLNTSDGERVYPTAYTFCLVNQDGKGGLYNLRIY
ncbi:MAG: hypothetical protein IJ769_05160 [Clostridia bacterium]|nr:hypothetical protein [Clostridia bacterium]